MKRELTLHVDASNHRDRQSLCAGLRHHEFVAESRQQFHPNRSTVNTLFTLLNRNRLQVLPARIDTGRIAQSELEMNWRSNAHNFRQFVIAGKSAESVWRLDI